ncbi:hypothetical protein QQ045_026942 [Rhodiola kirilowii]
MEAVQLPMYFDDLESSEDEIEPVSNSTAEAEAKVPSLVALCTEELKNRILLDEDYNVEDLCEFPPHLFEPLVMCLPPAALENFEQRCKSSRKSKGGGDRDTDEISSEMKKFKRSGLFDEAWRNLFEKRFWAPDLLLRPEPPELEIYDDWQQAYWQRHLQECINLATEQVFQSSYKGHLSQVPMPSKLLDLIGYKGAPSPSISKFMMVSHHCQQYGQYARCLRIRNVICIPELCDLLKTTELKGLILRRIRAYDEVVALCGLLKQNIKSLISLHFVDSALSSSDTECICLSLCSKELGRHLLQHITVANSCFPNPDGFEPFLFLGRSLRSISISNTRISQDFAERLFNILLDTSSSVEDLNLSENGISGWFSKLKQRTPKDSLKSLRKLSLRGNNVQKMEIDDLKFSLNFLPNLDMLDLKDNPIGDEGIGSLISCISEMAERSCFLKHLKLDNCLLSSDGAAHLLETLSSMKNQLLSLSIADNNLGSQIAAPLSRFLSTSILDLNIELIGLGAFGFEVLEREIKDELQLKRINISRNRGKSATAKIILKLISQAPELHTIEAAQNLMPPDSTLKVCSTLLMKTGNIEMVDLDGNIYDPSFDALGKDFKLKGKPQVMLPSFDFGPFIHDDDP